MRLPRHEGDQRRIDVWLAPSLGWLPVRFVQTEPNGTQVELLWHGQVAAADASGAANATTPSPGPTGTQPGPSLAAPSATNPGVGYEKP
jgi:hypothetical protein